jgi:ABC-type polysaccharide/polyol phosphate export permease
MLLDNNLLRLARCGLRPLRQARRATSTYADIHLLRELIKRDIQARFTGSALGVAWAILQPLSLVALYWFVFSFMLDLSRFGRGRGALLLVGVGIITSVKHSKPRV